jgi:malonyl-ACP O-methyltransferase BioC
MIKHLAKSTSRSPVRKAFSGSAHRYDEFAQLQQRIGDQLLTRFSKQKSFAHILDVGMGTGRMTEQLAQQFPGAQVVGVDFAEGMVAQARQRSRDYAVVQADAALLPFPPGQFDLIISNLAYQWVEEFGRAFLQNYQVLRPKGEFVAAFFGWHSLRELFECLVAAGAHDFFPRRLPALSDVEQALRASRFHIRELYSEVIRFDFHDMWQLLVWLKRIGANALPRRGYVGKTMMMKANQYYYQHFKTPEGIAVTFEVLWVEAYK